MEQPKQEFRLLTVKQVAEKLTVCVRTVEKLIQEGKLRVRWVGGQRRIAQHDVERFLGCNENDPPLVFAQGDG